MREVSACGVGKEGPQAISPRTLADQSILAHHFACGQVVVIAALECISVTDKAIAQLNAPMAPMPSSSTGRSLPVLSSVALLSLLAQQS